MTHSIIYQKDSKKERKNPLHPSSHVNDREKRTNSARQLLSPDTHYYIRTVNVPNDNSAIDQSSIRRSYKRRDTQEPSSFSLIRRQAEPTTFTQIPSGTPYSNISPTLTNTVTEFVTSATSSATPTATQKPSGQDPLSSVPVQIILGGLGSLCVIGVIIRCIRIGRQYDSSTNARQRQGDMESAVAQSSIHSSAARGIGGISPRNEMTNLTPTNELTLAGRLALYQVRSGVSISRYPYGQQPSTNENGEHLDSINSFVAPSYYCDVSPPPFLTTSGKPPAYADIMNSSHETEPRGDRDVSRDNPH